MAAPDLRAGGPPRRRAPRGDGGRARRARSAPAASRSRRTPTSSTSSRSSAATRSTSGSTRRCPGSASRRDEWAKPPTALSGGEQTRAALARLVIADPDLLLLDEPTNHLDLGALEWLEEHLRRRHGALLVASHDRAFLDATVTRVWELRDRRLTAFRGDYSAVPPPARGARRAGGEGRRHPGRAIAREQELVQRYRSQRKFSKMHEHEARLERLQAERVEAPKTSRKLRLPAGALAGGGAVALRRDRRPGRGPRRRLPARVAARSTPTAGRRRSRGASPRPRSSPPSAATGSASSGRTAPARRRSCGRSPATCRRSTGR